MRSILLTLVAGIAIRCHEPPAEPADISGEICHCETQQCRNELVGDAFGPGHCADYLCDGARVGGCS